MKRREFITLVGGAAVSWPLAARAQEGERMRRVGVLMAWLDTDPDIQARVAAFRQELRKLGWYEGVNLHIEERFGGDDMDHLRARQDAQDAEADRARHCWHRAHLQSRQSRD